MGCTATLKSYQSRGCNPDYRAVQAGDESSRTTLWFPFRHFAGFPILKEQLLYSIFGFTTSVCSCICNSFTVEKELQQQQKFMRRRSVKINVENNGLLFFSFICKINCVKVIFEEYFSALNQANIQTFKII